MLRSNNIKLTTILSIAVFVTSMVMGPVTSSVDDAFAKKKYKNWSDCREEHSKNWCNNYFKKHNNNNNSKGNNANQGIGQSQSSNQNSQCVSGKDAMVSCNNVQFQNQVNSGNNALSQIK